MQADEGHGGGIAAQPTGAIRFITVWPTHLSSKPTDGMTQVCVCVCVCARARVCAIVCTPLSIVLHHQPLTSTPATTLLTPT
jgi:hypothetical protein